MHTFDLSWWSDTRCGFAPYILCLKPLQIHPVCIYMGVVLSGHHRPYGYIPMSLKKIILVCNFLNLTLTQRIKHSCFRKFWLSSFEGEKLWPIPNPHQLFNALYSTVGMDPHISHWMGCPVIIFYTPISNINLICFNLILTSSHW